MQFEVDSAYPGTVTPPSFSPSNVSVAVGSTANYSVTLPSTSTNVSASCLNLPTGTACSYSSTAGAVSITTSATSPVGNYQVTVVFNETVPGTASAAVLLPFLLLPLAILRKRLPARGVKIGACLWFVLLISAFGIGCGGGGSGSSPISPVNPTHQVTSSGVVRLMIQ